MKPSSRLPGLRVPNRLKLKDKTSPIRPLCSVPRNVKDPITADKANIDDFLNMLVVARDAKVKWFVYTASSSTYDDHTGLPKFDCTEMVGKTRLILRFPIIFFN